MQMSANIQPNPQTTISLFRVRATIRALASREPDDRLRVDVEKESERRITSALTKQTVTLRARPVPPPPRVIVRHTRPGAAMSHLLDPKPLATAATASELVIHRVLFGTFDPSDGLAAYARAEADRAFRSAWELHKIRRRAEVDLCESLKSDEEGASQKPTPVGSPSVLSPKRREQALAQLSEPLATAAALQLDDDRSQAELAGELNMTRAAFAQRVSRAITQLVQADFGDVAEALRRRRAVAAMPVAADNPRHALRRAGDVVQVAVIGNLSGRSRQEIAIDAAGLVEEVPVLTPLALQAAYHEFLELFAPDQRRAALTRLRAQLEQEHESHFAENPKRRDIEPAANGAYRRLLERLRAARRRPARP